MATVDSVNSQQYLQEEEEDGIGLGIFSLQFFLRTFLLNWIWFVLSLVISLGAAAIYLRYTPPVYSIMAKMIIKDDSKTTTRSRNVSNGVLTGTVNTFSGFDNEMEILRSVVLAEDAIHDSKLYVNYTLEGTVTDKPMYGNQPVNVDMDRQHLDALKNPVILTLSQSGDEIEVSGTYNGGKSIYKKGRLPMVINCGAGIISVVLNPEGIFTAGKDLMVTINNPKTVARQYAGNMSTSSQSESTSIAILSRADILPQRSIDYLKKLVDCYNRQANDDKNQISIRTEQFINNRLAKINKELGSTDETIEDYKRANRITDAGSNAALSLSNTDEADNSLAEMNTQIMLMQSVADYMRMPENKYQTLPSNVGLTDPAATSLISQYNTLALDRNRLLRSASEHSPAVTAITGQMDDLVASINRAIDQAKRTMKIQRNAIMKRYNKYNAIFEGSPQQERILTQIGRQQSVKSALYTMLLQKREENSISLAATANKGRLLDDPVCTGVIQPNRNKIWSIAFGIGFFLPLFFFIVKELTRYRIEGHEDVIRLTNCPVIADIALANEKVKGTADIVVQENKNNQMEEIFRSMRTNLQFVLKENQNVIMFTSSTAGEGKTFTAANLGVSFALLGKKVVLVGLDIRRPRLSTLFGFHGKTAGITNLLVHDNPTAEQVKAEIVPSGINRNLDIMLAGPVPPNPAELVSRSSLDAIFRVLRSEYDYVIVDTAPVGLVTDTLQIGRVADVTCVICRADYTEKAAFQVINSFAASKKLPNVCIAINGIDMSKKKYGYAYGYGKYGKYGKYGYRAYSKYGYSYSRYGYHSYGYGNYSNSHYGNPNDDSVKV